VCVSLLLKEGHGYTAFADEQCSCKMSTANCSTTSDLWMQKLGWKRLCWNDCDKKTSNWWKENYKRFNSSHVYHPI